MAAGWTADAHDAGFQVAESLLVGRLMLMMAAFRLCNRC